MPCLQMCVDENREMLQTVAELVFSVAVSSSCLFVASVEVSSTHISKARHAIVPCSSTRGRPL